MEITAQMGCHVTKIKRKPKGVGAELKDAACSQTQVIIALEIQEGKEEMATKKYMQEWKKAGTAQVLRLTEPWHGSGRVLTQLLPASQRLKPVESMVYISLA